MNNVPAEYWIVRLGLTLHIEGGAFREVYRSPLILPKQHLTTGHAGDRNAMTSIYFLLQYGEFSAFHRIASDELWYFHCGAPLNIYEISPDGELTRHTLSDDPETGGCLMIAIKAGSWFGSRVEEPGAYTLCSCAVAPGFDFQDFELADRDALTGEFPRHRRIIEQLTR